MTLNGKNRVPYAVFRGAATLHTLWCENIDAAPDLKAGAASGESELSSVADRRKSARRGYSRQRRPGGRNESYSEERERPFCACTRRDCSHLACDRSHGLCAHHECLPGKRGAGCRLCSFLEAHPIPGAAEAADRTDSAVGADPETRGRQERRPMRGKV